MATRLTLNTDLGADGAARVTAAGEIDLSNVDLFTRALTGASGGTRSRITVDLGAVKYLDSAAINALFDHAEEVDHLHVIVHPLLVRVLTVSGFSKIATLEAATAPTGKGEHSDKR
jgi:anti-anti-sigma factor